MVPFNEYILGFYDLCKSRINMPQNVPPSTGFPSSEPVIGGFEFVIRTEPEDITANELKEALNEAHIKIDETELEKIVNEVDYHGDKMINYSEFLSATISVKKILTFEKLHAIFN